MIEAKGLQVYQSAFSPLPVHGDGLNHLNHPQDHLLTAVERLRLTVLEISRSWSAVYFQQTSIFFAKPRQGWRWRNDQFSIG